VMEPDVQLKITTHPVVADCKRVQNEDAGNHAEGVVLRLDIFLRTRMGFLVLPVDREVGAGPALPAITGLQTRAGALL
jgi:hypothetical protein